jgi:hypothetical protein
MARRSRSAQRSTWSIAFYLLLVLVGGLMLAKTARADDTQEPLKEEKNTVSGPVIGIDLGTTYSCVGIMKGGKVEIMVNDQGKCKLSDVVCADAETDRWLLQVTVSHRLGSPSPTTSASLETPQRTSSPPTPTGQSSTS